MGSQLDLCKVDPAKRVEFLFTSGNYADKLAIICFDGQWQDVTSALVRAYNHGPTDTTSIAGVMAQIAVFLRSGEDWHLDQLRRDLEFGQTHHSSFFDKGPKRRDIQVVTHSLCGGYKAEIAKTIPGAEGVYKSPKKDWQATLRVLSLQQSLEIRDYGLVSAWLKRIFSWVREVELLRAHNWFLMSHEDFHAQLFSGVTPGILGQGVEGNHLEKIRS